jgi:hypothetical protein
VKQLIQAVQTYIQNFQKSCSQAGNVTQCEKIGFSQATLKQGERCSHWTLYAGCEPDWFSQAVVRHSARTPEDDKKIENKIKSDKGL